MTISEDIKKITQDEMMKEFKGEISGILNWALEGWRDYNENGLNVPEVVKIATSEYKSESDTLAAFISENVSRILWLKSTQPSCFSPSRNGL